MRHIAATLAAACILAQAHASAQTLQDTYRKKGTWVRTLVDARESLSRASEEAGEPTRLPDFGADDFSVTAWVRTDSGGTIIAKAPAEGPWAPQGKTLFIRDGRLCYDIGWVGVVTSERSVNDGAWHHVAMAKSGTQIHLYVDHEPDTTGHLNSLPDIDGHALKIGFTSTNFPSTGFVGEIDEVKLYHGALSGEQIRAGDGRVAGHWPFEADGTDASGGRNHAHKTVRADHAKGKVGKALSLPGQGAHVLLTDPRGGSAGEALWALLARDFPTASREIAWERGDGIWAAGWAPGDIGDLASRYAKASWRAPFLAERANSLAAGAKDWADVEAAREVYIASRKHAALTATLDRYDLDALREGVSYLQREYADDYADAEGFLERASDLEERVHAFRKGDVDDQRLESDLQALQREALVDANPLIDFDEVLFVRRHTYQSNHYYTDYINGCKNFGGNICRLSLGSGEVTELAPELAEGIFGRLDLDFDGKRIVFDHKARIGEGFRVWEVGVDGEGLRQVTLPPSDEAERIRRYKINEEYQHHTDDMQPCYLPDGGICFISSRCEFGILCDSPDLFTTTVLHRVDRDGSNMLKLTNSSVSEATPTVMNDGRILYTRWEYVDKGAVSIKCLWAINPDGSGSYEVYGNDIALPPTMLHGRAIPGSDYLFSMLGTPHCPQSGVGTVIRLDISKDIRTREPMTYITPTVDIRAEGGFHNLVDGAWQQVQNGPLYGDPYPLSESFFLVAHNPDRPWNDTSAYGLYLIDEFGNRVLLHEDESISCWHPTPLRARPRPPLRASMLPEIAEAGDTATVVLQDVYDGLDGVARGAVKYIRVMEQVPRPWSARRYWDGDLYDQQHAVITKDTHLGLKVLHGVVPVEEDGSACITVPSDKNVFFQALDENHMELQRMRTYVNLRPGETRTCVGCHKRHDLAPPVGSTLALAKPPVVPGPQPGEVAPRPIYYAADVQPVWDRHCVACHNTDDPQGELDLSGAMTPLFNRSYESILARGLLPIIGENHPKVGNAEYLPPKALGSHASKLVQTLLDGHHGARLSREEMVRVTTWVDSNAQYYGSYFGRRNTKYRDYPDFRPTPTLASALGTPPEPMHAIISGETRHPFLVADHSGGGPMRYGPRIWIFAEDGEPTWSHSCSANVHDPWVLPNGNVLFASEGVREVTPDGDVVFEYESDLYITACQRLPNGNTLIGENPLNRLVEVSPDGEIVKAVQLTTSCEDPGRNFRLARQLVNGNYLVAHDGEGMVREYSPEGVALREIPSPGGAYAAVRLPNGNTLISCGAAKRVIEVDQAGETVWELSESDLPGVRLNWLAGVQRLPNGNTVIVNWFSDPNDYAGRETPQIIEVTRDKALVWSFAAPDLVGSANNVQLLDVSGDATRWEILR